MGKSLDTITEREKEKIKRIHDRRNFKVPTGQLINLYCWAWNRLEEEVDDPETFIIEAFDHIDPSLEYDEFAEELRDYLAPLTHPEMGAEMEKERELEHFRRKASELQRKIRKLKKKPELPSNVVKRLKRLEKKIDEGINTTRTVKAGGNKPKRR